ncbi:UxaA family hydrolase [Deltaproteobacteria bacterium OttesenSCG-928-M10]|nr:UxaA family hydrolase [Deltaproteobacteria bacterium OttesenSCG-928-M10]
MTRALKLDDKDNVATVLADTLRGEMVRVVDGAQNLWAELSAREDIPEGHKIALALLEKDQPVFKYGQIISRSSRTIEPGEWVHTHNSESERGRGDV